MAKFSEGVRKRVYPTEGRRKTKGFAALAKFEKSELAFEMLRGRGGGSRDADEKKKGKKVHGTSVREVPFSHGRNDRPRNALN